MAIVIDAAEGLGFGIAKRLGREGARVTGVDVNSALVHQAPDAHARDVCNAFSGPGHVGRNAGPLAVHQGGMPGQGQVFSLRHHPTRDRVAEDVQDHPKSVAGQLLWPQRIQRQSRRQMRL